MRVIEINTTQDTYDCDLCGMDWADGGKIYIDNELVDEVEPVAHCFGGTSVSEGELIILALAHMGIDVIVDGDRSHISCVEVDERRDKALEIGHGDRDRHYGLYEDVTKMLVDFVTKKNYDYGIELLMEWYYIRGKYDK